MSYAVAVPRSLPPKFPDRCVLCGADNPGKQARFHAGANYGAFFFMAWFETGRKSITAPACGSCAVSAMSRGLLRFAVSAGCAILAGWYLFWVMGMKGGRGLGKLKAVAVFFAAVIPAVIWDWLFPAKFSVTFDDENHQAVCHFSDPGYAAEGCQASGVERLPIRWAGAERSIARKVSDYDLTSRLTSRAETPMKNATCCLAVTLAAMFSAEAVVADETSPYVRLASGVSGHVHPSACVTKKGTVLVIFSQQEYIDLRITRSSDGGKTWTEPTKYGPTQKINIYPGSLTTLSDGRILHVWNVWYADKEATGGKTRFAQFSLSDDDGQTWSEPRSLAKPKTPEPHSVLRHPIVELAPDQWLFPLMDRTIVYNAKTGEEKSFGDGRNHGLVPIVKTVKGTLISGLGLRSTDAGKTWETISPFPKIGTDGWRYDLMTADNGWLVAGEVLGPGVGGDKWRFVVSRDDGKSWDFDSAKDFYNPGRPIGGRACPKTVQLDQETLGTVFYDVEEKQPGGSGVFFLRTPIQRL